MSNVTQLVNLELDDYFKETERELEERVGNPECPNFLEFIAEYIQRFPTPAEYIYQKLFEKKKTLCECYTDYKLEELLPGAEEPKQVTAFRNHYEEKKKEFQQRMEEYTIQKEAHEKDPENNPEPRKPKKIPPFFYIYFYNEDIIKSVLKEYTIKRNQDITKKALKEDTFKFKEEWRDVISKQGYLFVYDTKQANAVRSMMFDLALALEWDVTTLRNMLNKVLLQADFNPKNIREAMYWYCLENQTSYAEICSEYLAYRKNNPLLEEDGPDHKFPAEGMRHTEDWKDKLKKVVKKEKEDFFSYLWKLEHIEVDINRKTPSGIYWNEFRCFPRKVWTGEQPDARNLVTSTELFQNGLLEEEADIKKVDVMDNVQLDSLEGIIEVIIRLYPKRRREGSEDEIDRVTFKDMKNLPEPPLHTHSKDENSDGLCNESVKQEDKKGETSEKVFEYSEEEYRTIFPLILEKSRKNCYAANTKELLPPDILKSIFGKLDYTESKVEKRQKGRVPLSRTDIVATEFISFFSDFAKPYPKKNNLKKRMVGKFWKEVSDDLIACGLYKFYPRSPFELFLILCFWQDDPFAYFMASWEESRKEPQKES